MTRLLLISALVLSLLTGPAVAAVPDNATVGQWTARSMMTIMSFGFSDYEERKAENRKYFTAHGYETFYEAMDRSRIPEMVVKNQMATTLKVTCAPEAAGPVLKDGVKTWTLKMPVVLTYQSGHKSRDDMLQMTIVVQEDKDASNPEKLGIDQSITVPMDEGEDASMCNETDRLRGQIISLKAERDELEKLITRLEEKIKEREDMLKEKKAP